MFHLRYVIDNALRRWPHKTAVWHEGSDWTYQELEEASNRLASGLRKRGVGPGTRVALFMPNCPEFVLTYLACFKLNAIAVPINHRYTSSEVTFALRHSGASVLIGHTKFQRALPPLDREGPALSDVYMVGDPRVAPTWTRPFTELLSTGRAEPADVVDNLDQPALILFTSGSTGNPKAAVHTHRSLSAMASLIADEEFVRGDQRMLVSLPICYVGGLVWQLLPTLMSGASATLAMKPSPEQMVDLIASRKISITNFLASDAVDFVDHLEKNPRPLPSLEYVGIGGDKVPDHLHRRFRAAAGIRLTEQAGMTECGLYSNNPAVGRVREGSMGRPSAGVQMRIIDDEGRDRSTGQVGEIVIRSSGLITGYWNNATATNEAFRDGWFHTGDLARRDEDGYLWFVGRSKHIIIRRGSNLAPKEVEDAIDRHPGVRASVVVGAPHEKDGEVPVAFVAVRSPGATIQGLALEPFLSKTLATYKIPVHFELVDDLPRTVTGKFDRTGMKRIAADIMTGDVADFSLSGIH
ncbi:Long-chain-fatty-acid--CoA ligase [Planctomycetes bacterium Pan216]|uniref:Long-chain-fatty-acid--CoA ligase n=1 Tax=Kolteria novifilia TaxID=2527975 RepID=A0A518B475_9BACT|nr:Long-chain-fatty-acid--CoA ligase [Planctomycetes bacterium Pan216]